ncbi:MAG TPA: hypothetical protein VGD98_08150 [Ktedonobacteraceae bacterium]
MIILKPTPGSSTPTDAQITNTISILSQRLSDFGLSNAQVSQVTANKQPAIQVKVPRFAGDESSTLNRLLATGRIEFWITGTNEVQINTTLDPTQYTQNNPGGQAAFTNQDLAASQCSVGTDGTEATFQNQS